MYICRRSATYSQRVSSLLCAIVGATIFSQEINTGLKTVVKNSLFVNYYGTYSEFFLNHSSDQLIDDCKAECTTSLTAACSNQYNLANVALDPGTVVKQPTLCVCTYALEVCVKG